MADHAKLSASKAARWLACPGSIRLSEGLPDRVTDAGKEGTYAHGIAAAFLTDPKFNVDPDDPAMSAEMYAAIGMYVTYCRSLCGRGWVEMDLHPALETLHPDFGGTADYVNYYWRTKLLEIIDFKFGKSKVKVENNWQLIKYAAGALLTIRKTVARIRLTIVQPRGPGKDPIRSWDITPADLIGYVAQLVKGGLTTEAQDAPLQPGSHCWFCTANQFVDGCLACPVQEAKRHERVINLFSNLMGE